MSFHNVGICSCFPDEHFLYDDLSPHSCESPYHNLSKEDHFPCVHLEYDDLWQLSFQICFHSMTHLRAVQV
jgi:hypothetical protein